MLGNHAFEAGESDLGMTAMPPTFQLAAGDTPKPPNGQEDSASGEALENGTLKSITTQMGEGISKGGDAAVKDDEASTVSTGANVETELNLSFNQKESEGSKGGKKDPVAAKVANGTFKQPGGLPVSAFGSEDYEPSFSGISYKFSGGKCIITANLVLSCPWG
ncbi:MAG TPA: hypothetical protein ENJ82_12285, partial [Bacteroidetes bacterium]|nr:hypothetical protein [Bacteroidota bacterium]